MADQYPISSVDADVTETQEWLEALASVIQEAGPERAEFLLKQLLENAAHAGITAQGGFNTPYINTIAVDQEEKMPHEGPEVTRLRSLIRWNAVMMVLRAGKKDSSLGGHLATFASAAMLY